ncbi:hypothetical protein ANN_20217 [Periplaneta americana]|uniref:Uncharacterized protein n=1 Tax=Periplaneta americana TaxID=6978 RepID=A0ABQ8SCI1_PERAM|nr:hypothetical protein ANN_20217 [Periplaneta americana]
MTPFQDVGLEEEEEINFTAGGLPDEAMDSIWNYLIFAFQLQKKIQPGNQPKLESNPFLSEARDQQPTRYCLSYASDYITTTTSQWRSVNPETTFIADLTVPLCWKREFVDIEVRSLSHVQRHKSPSSEL